MDNKINFRYIGIHMKEKRVVNRDLHLKKLRKILESTKLPDEINDIEILVNEILDLKEEKNAVILGHNYMTPDVYYGISDFAGDSLGLSRHAAETDADIILFNGVHFMAETAKILNPEKKVLIADKLAGCSLSESISADDVRKLKEENPGIPAVTYINCSAEVKAECDIVCTSANAVEIIESMPTDTVIMIPDNYLSANVQKQCSKKIISWAGKCMVHELFSATDVMLTRKHYPDITVIAHPECKPEVTELADFSGSTSQMSGFIKKSNAKQVMLMTECSMGENLQSSFENVEFISTCQSCPHMKKITLEKVKTALIKEQFEVEVEEEIRIKAKKALDAMLALK